MGKEIRSLALVLCCLWPTASWPQDSTSRLIYDSYPSTLGLKPFLGPRCPEPTINHIFHWSVPAPNLTPYCNGEIQGIRNEPIRVFLGKEAIFLCLYYIGDHGFPGVFVEIDSAKGLQKDWYTVQFWRKNGGPDLVLPGYNFSRMTNFGKGRVAAACRLGLRLSDGGPTFRGVPLTFTFENNLIACNGEVRKDVLVNNAESALEVFSQPTRATQTSVSPEISDALMTRIAAVDLLDEAYSKGVTCDTTHGRPVCK